MARRLPPLNALRAFEAAARHLSFSKAATELHVTPAAVSHQIKGLENVLGAALFKRRNRAVTLTEAGQKCLPGIVDGFDCLAAALEKLKTEERSGPLTVTVSPAFAAKWLVPRLERFQARHPEIDVRVSASLDVVDFRVADVDMGVRYGRGVYPGLRADRLFDDAVSPLCSPRLTQGKNGLKRPGDLARFTLLHDETTQRSERPDPDWRMWLKAAGVTGIDAARGMRFSNAELALQAAIDGAGVVLGRRRLAGGDMAAGRLVAPFALRLPLEFAFWVVCPEESCGKPKVAAFRAWLLEEAAAEAATD